ncbi:MAG TPA: class I SAM-dependent methyltransferase, partial [Bacteroidia bacterium]|nr:class I SAM-dependent methyltransferase [Bacteroidia bacterium]
GLSPGGKLITFEISDEVAVIAKKHFEAAGISDKIEIRIGNALEMLPEIVREDSSGENKIDLVFIDADKENYSAYWDILFPKLRPGGIIIADNVLWSGKVLDPENEQDEETRGLIAFTKKALAEKNSEQVLIPVRDGLLVIRKKG